MLPKNVKKFLEIRRYQSICTCNSIRANVAAVTYCFLETRFNMTTVILQRMLFKYWN